MLWFLPSFKKTPVFHSKISGDITIKKRYGKLAVLTGEITQSGGEIYFMWKKVVEGLKKERHEIPTCLVLGIGGGTVIEFLHKVYPQINITGVELDPVMITIAKEHFVLKDKIEFQIIEDDALSYVEKERHIYDLIVVDLYVGKLNPKKTREDKFIRSVKRLLKPQGIVIYNAHYQSEEDHRKLLHMFDKLFSSSKEVFSYPLNRVIQLYSNEKVK